jgi:hypothetical protein
MRVAERPLPGLPVAGSAAASERSEPEEPYARPADWLALPTVNVGEQKFVGLHAVYEQGPNYAALTYAGGAYTVDWGDGRAPVNVANGVTAQADLSYEGCGAGSLSTRGYRQAIVTVSPPATTTRTGSTFASQVPQ